MWNPFWPHTWLKFARVQFLLSCQSYFGYNLSMRASIIMWLNTATPAKVTPQRLKQSTIFWRGRCSGGLVSFDIRIYRANLLSTYSTSLPVRSYTEQQVPKKEKINSWYYEIVSKKLILTNCGVFDPALRHIRAVQPRYRMLMQATMSMPARLFRFSLTWESACRRRLHLQEKDETRGSLVSRIDLRRHPGTEIVL